MFESPSAKENIQQLSIAVTALAMCLLSVDYPHWHDMTLLEIVKNLPMHNW
jgi:hypothetical protein